MGLAENYIFWDIMHFGFSDLRGIKFGQWIFKNDSGQYVAQACDS